MIDNEKQPENATEREPETESECQAQPEPKRGRPTLTRRGLCLGLGGAAVMLGIGGVKYLGDTPVVRPPGGQDSDKLLAACIRCQKCTEICPRDVIAPSHIENGILGMRTPTLSFSENYCDFCAEHNGGVPLCAEACPTGALTPPVAPAEKTTVLGLAEINTDWCLAYKLIGCRFCYDACPYEAIELDEYNRPHVIDEACNGCGACEAACVSLENASIAEGATARAIVVVPDQTRER